MKKWKFGLVLIATVLLVLSPAHGASEQGRVSHSPGLLATLRATSWPEAWHGGAFGPSFLRTARPLHPALGAASSPQSLSGQSATLLPNGQVLLLGGLKGNQPVATATIIDPKTGFRAQLGKGMLYARYGHTATVLPNGTVLVVGGIGKSGQAETSLERFDPSTAMF